MEEIRDLVAKAPTRGLPWPRVKLKDVLTQATVPCKVSAAESYPNFGIFSFGRGLFKKPPISGAATSAQVLYQVRKGQLIYSRLFAFEGAYGLVTEPFDGHYVSNEYPAFDIDDSKVLPAYLALYFTWPVAWHELAKRTSGMGNRRRRLQPEHFLSHEIPLPELSEQRRIVSDIEAVQSVEVLHNATGEDLRALKQGFLNRTFTG